MHAQVSKLSISRFWSWFPITSVKGNDKITLLYMINTRLRKLKEAVAIFSESLTIDKFFMEAYVSRGNAFLDYGNEAGLKAAQADYERALVLKPTYLPARYADVFVTNFNFGGYSE